MGCNGSKNTAAASAPVEKQQSLEGDFKLTLEKTSDEQTLGLRVIDVEPNCLRVEAVKEEGLVPAFIKANENAPEQHVKVGDLIVAVNGVSGAPGALKAELQGKTIILTVKRSEQPAVATDAATAETPAPATDAEPAAEPVPAANPEVEAEAPPAGDSSDALPAEPVADAPVASATATEAVDADANQETAIDVVVVDADQAVQDDAATEEKLCKMSVC